MQFCVIVRSKYVYYIYIMGLFILSLFIQDHSVAFMNLISDHLCTYAVPNIPTTHGGTGLSARSSAVLVAKAS